MKKFHLREPLEVERERKEEEMGEKKEKVIEREMMRIEK